MLEDAEDTSPEVRTTQPLTGYVTHSPTCPSYVVSSYQHECELLLQAKELVQDIGQMYKNILMLNVKMKKYKATPVSQHTCCLAVSAYHEHSCL